MIDAATVIAIHDVILATEPGLHGRYGDGPLEGALSRVENAIHYAGLDDVFEMAAMYAVAIARGHVFNDANKRTALVTALTYLSMQGIDIDRTPALEDVMVDVASGDMLMEELANVFYTLAPDGEPKLTLDQKLALFDPEKHGGEVMATGRVGAEAF